MEFSDLAQNIHTHIDPKLRQGFRLDETVVVLPNDGEVISQGHRYHLPPKALEILLFLCENQHQLVSSEDLIMFGWGDPKTRRSSLTHVISEIRHALNDHKECPEFIQTLPRKGYRMIARVSELDEKIVYPNVWPIKHSAITELPKPNGNTNQWQFSFALLRNSKLFSVSIAFFVVTWVLLQVLELIFPIFDIPEWGLKIAVLVLVVGFPLALLFTWLKEIKLKKYLFNKETNGDKKKYFFKQLAVDFGFIGCLSIVVGFIALYLIESIEQEQNAEPEQVPAFTVNLPIKDKLIAVLPFKFEHQSFLPEYFSGTFQGELIHALSSQNEFSLVSQRAVNDLAEDSKIEDYVARLGARYLLEGQIIASKQKFSIMLNLLDTKSALQIWSATIDGSADKLLTAQKAVYRQVFNALALLSQKQPKDSVQIINTNDFKSYDNYIQGKNKLATAKNMAELSQAERYFLGSLKFDPGFSLATAGLCQTYLEQYQESHEVLTFESAQKTCGSLLAIEQLKEEAYVALGNLNRLSGEHLTAINFYHRAKELNPQNLQANSGEALSKHKIGHTQEAEALLQKNIQIEPGYWKNYMTLGTFLFNNGEYQRAIEQYRRVTLLKPGYEQGYNNLGASYFLTDQIEEAGIAWRQSVEIAPSANSYSNLGSALFFSQDFEAARQSYSKAAKLKPADPVLWANLGDAQKFSGKLPQAKNSYQKALELALAKLSVNPHDLVMQASLARYQSELNQCVEPLKKVQQLASKSISDPYLFYDFSLVSINCNKKAQARELINKAVKLGYPEKLLTRDIQFKTIFNKKISY